jgi:hypothetical protein
MLMLRRIYPSEHDIGHTSKHNIAFSFYQIQPYPALQALFLITIVGFEFE